MASKHFPSKESTDPHKEGEVILSDLIKPILESKEIEHFVPYSEYCHVIYHQTENDRVSTSWKDYPKDLVSKMFASKLSSNGDDILTSPFTKVS